MQVSCRADAGTCDVQLAMAEHAVNQVNASHLQCLPLRLVDRHANEARAAAAVPCCGWTGPCWAGSGSGRGCLSGGGHGGGCLVVVVVMAAPVSQ